jgi:hypothetical protein
MASTYPSSLDNFTNPLNTDKLNNPPHATQHADNNDAIEALQAKVGTGASTPTNNTFLIGNGTGTSAYSALTSAQLAARISDETGTGLSVFNDTPTIITPTIASFTNAQHNHTNSAGGGLITRSSFDTTYTTEINTDWKAGLLPAVSSVTENGNRSADMTFASTVANILTPGMRIRTSRTVAAPTASISLNGTTQYGSRATGIVTGVTFTDNYSCSAWVRLTSYQQGVIIGRYSVNGFFMRVESTGQLLIAGGNGGAIDYATSYQSLPLNKWVHVAATMNVAGAVSTMYIDGVLVPNLYTNSAATSVTQTGDLAVGALSGGSVFFPGNIVQASVHNAILTQAQIRAMKNQTISSSTPSIVAGYLLDQASGLNDVSANANNLTANGSPTYTAGTSPFTTNANGTAGGSLDYAIVTNVSTTVATVQYPEGCAIPTSGGISTVDYSGVKAPFGMPTQRSRWQILTLNKVTASQSAPTSGTWYNTSIGAIQILLPVGSWDFGYSVMFGGFKTAATSYDVYCTLSTTSSTETDNDLTSWVLAEGALGAITPRQLFNRTKRLDVSTATQYYFNGKTATASGGDLSTYGTYGSSLVTADLSYL